MEPQKGKQAPKTLLEAVEHLIFYEGWERLLQADVVSESGLVQIRRRTESDSQFSETDIVGNYTPEQFIAGVVTQESIRYDCRQYLQAND